MTWRLQLKPTGPTGKVKLLGVVSLAHRSYYLVAGITRVEKAVSMSIRLVWIESPFLNPVLLPTLEMTTVRLAIKSTILVRPFHSESCSCRTNSLRVLATTLDPVCRPQGHIPSFAVKRLGLRESNACFHFRLHLRCPVSRHSLIVFSS